MQFQTLIPNRSIRDIFARAYLVLYAVKRATESGELAITRHSNGSGLLQAKTVQVSRD
jgi:hypothetical protein